MMERRWRSRNSAVRKHLGKDLPIGTFSDVRNLVQTVIFFQRLPNNSGINFERLTYPLVTFGIS